ncbi:hypothetical protein DPEC_G00208360 [Dallia pectoralis]|uniref:Uncharacterized protein n=1 Tax=Dallia pectoralis TaxID=75939 RepID=A0ACC2G599_DALPE|nr:hypothetical protein DPEC_G00208360 [Dallia pectoralis]
MEAGGKDEDETLQTAFKKLRVDAESLPASVHICESTTRMVNRTCPEGAKSKLSCPKENWHGSSMRKTSRGAVRNQRRRRSKSPILHPPKFTYCGSKMLPPPGHLMHKSLSEAEGCCSSLGVPAKKELLSLGHSSPVFGGAGYEPHNSAASEGPTTTLEVPRRPLSDNSGIPEAAACVEADTVAVAGVSGAVPSDFQSLSQHRGGPCACAESEGRCQCPAWQGVEVYSFTGLRNVISECERNLARPEDGSQTSPHQRTQTAGSTTLASSSPRSCSEQARAYVDDITIEDLSGYMEYYLYIPKKMSHMAEMMYT